MPARQKNAGAPRRKRAAPARKRLTPSKEARGTTAAETPLALDAPEIAPLVARVRAAGGAPLGAYREPLSGQALVLATLPLGAVEPTPFQRDLSPTHAKRLAQKIDEAGAFLDPIIAVSSPPAPGRGGVACAFWSPNGRHRLAAAKVLGLRQITALVSPDVRLAFRILALNTEKAHNLKDRALEVVRMAQAIAADEPRAREHTFTAEFEAPELLTLGLVYQREPRFAGGAYNPMLRKVDRFGDVTLAKGLRDRAGVAARLLDIDRQVKAIIKELERRGFRSPYLRSYVVARLNPVRWHRAKKGDTTPPMTVAAALTRMAAAAKRFDAATVRERDLALVAAVAPAE